MNWSESRGDPHTSTAGWEVLLTLIETYMTPIHCDLYTTFSFTWVWPWRNVAPQIYMSAIISALQLISPFYFPQAFFQFCMHPPTPPLSQFLSLSFLLFLSVSLGSPAEGSKCKSSRTIFFRTALITADDVSKEVKGTTQRPLQLFPPFTACRFMPLLSFFSFLPPLPLFFSPTFSTLSISIGPCT